MSEWCKTPEAVGSASCFFYDWQTLISGLVAVLVALIGSALVWRQVILSKTQERERLRRRFNAAKATLSHTLSDICEYARDAVDALKSIHLASGQHAFGASQLGLQVPPVPLGLTSSLERVVEAANDPKLADAITAILSEVQILNARLRDLSRLSPHRLGLQSSVEDYIIQAARVYASTSSLFGYARGEVDNIEDSEQKTVLSALSLLGVDDSNLPRVIQTAARRYSGQ